MLQPIQQALRRNYQPLNKILVSKKHLKKNYSHLSRLNPSIKVAPVLKSNAYGHGIVEVAQILDTLKLPFLCVDSLYEAYQLLNIDIKTPILIMGYVAPLSLKTKRLPFSYAVFDKEMLQAIAKYQPHAGIHLFVDTGMGREGMLMSEIEELAGFAQKSRLKIEGVMSHLAMPDKPQNPFTQKQILNFKKAIQILKNKKIDPKWKHVASSVGLLELKNYQGLLGNASRTGIGLYGIDPIGRDAKLLPVLSFQTHIAQVKWLSKGDKVGYDFTYEAKDRRRVAVLPVGYNDGIPRALSNKGFVKIKKIYCPIVGKVSMNITMVDITETNAKKGEVVEVFSNKTQDRNSILNTAKLANTIPYVILTNLHPSTKREVVNS